MTLEDLGNIGEFVAAIATLITLIYLAAQIRRSSTAVEAATNQAVSDSTQQRLLAPAHNPELAAALAKARGARYTAPRGDSTNVVLQIGIASSYTDRLVLAPLAFGSGGTRPHQVSDSARQNEGRGGGWTVRLPGGRAACEALQYFGRATLRSYGLCYETVTRHDRRLARRAVSEPEPL